MRGTDFLSKNFEKNKKVSSYLDQSHTLNNTFKQAIVKEVFFCGMNFASTFFEGNN